MLYKTRFTRLSDTFNRLSMQDKPDLAQLVRLKGKICELFMDFDFPDTLRDNLKALEADVSRFIRDVRRERGYPRSVLDERTAL